MRSDGTFQHQDHATNQTDVVTQLVQRNEMEPTGIRMEIKQQNEIHENVDSVVSRNLADYRVALPGDTRIAPPGGMQAASPGRVRVAIVRSLPIHNDGGVLRYRA